MLHASRFVRPREPPPLVLQLRDRRILASVYEHRYLSAEHIRTLHFPGICRRAVQARLRKLWASRLLDRHFIPFLLDGVHRPPPSALCPFYILSARGARIVAGELGVPASEVPHTPKANARGYATLAHHLVVTDLLVALAAACRDDPHVRLVRVEREAQLRARLAAAPRGARVLVPDGAFSLRQGPSGRDATFYVEVVRADVRGGNATLLEKLRRYVALNREGALRAAYGHGHVRAVLILTTSHERAEHLRRLASSLTHGRSLFWFGVYRAVAASGREGCAWDPSNVLSPRWRTADGLSVSLRDPDRPRAIAPA